MTKYFETQQKIGIIILIIEYHPLAIEWHKPHLIDFRLVLN